MKNVGMFDNDSLSTLLFSCYSAHPLLDNAKEIKRIRNDVKENREWDKSDEEAEKRYQV